MDKSKLQSQNGRVARELKVWETSIWQNLWFWRVPVTLLAKVHLMSTQGLQYFEKAKITQNNIEYQLQYSLFFTFLNCHRNRLFLYFLVNYRISIISLLFRVSIPNPDFAIGGGEVENDITFDHTLYTEADPESFGEVGVILNQLLTKCKDV